MMILPSTRRRWLAAALAWACVRITSRGAEPVEAFAITTFSGERLQTTALRGKTIVLEWLDLACPCTERHYRAGTVQRAQALAKADGVIWISLFAESKAAIAEAEFQPKIEQALRLWNSAATHRAADPEAALAKRFGLTFTPTAVIIAPDGTLAYHGALDSSTLQGETPEAVSGATSFITQALEDLKAGRPIRLPKTPTLGCALRGAPAG
jgi:hypothetical protein